MRGRDSRSLGLVAGAAVLVGRLAACSISVTTTKLHDDRADRSVRPNGTAVIVGDSLGYGTVVFGGLWDRLGHDGWGPVRSVSVLGLHSVPETSTDGNNVVSRIANFRAEGLVPAVAVIIAGADDVGYPGGGDVARDSQRIEGALAALGDIPVVCVARVLAP